MKAIKIACLAGIIGHAALAGGCARILIADDAIVQRGAALDLAAHVKNQSLFVFTSGVPKTSVEFFIKDRRIGGSETDGAGCARVGLRGRSDDGPYIARTVFEGRTLECSGNVFTWDPDRVGVAIDLDECICATNYFNLIWGDGLLSPPIESAAETLQRLSEDYQIVYYSARPRFMIPRTREWLRKYEFPSGPILFPDALSSVIRQTESKTKVLADLRQRWPNVLIGIGDRLVDVEVCTANKMLPVIVNPALPKFREYAVVVPDWKAVENLLREHRDTLTDPGLLRVAIQEKSLDAVREGGVDRPSAVTVRLVSSQEEAR